MDNTYRKAQKRGHDWNRWKRYLRRIELAVYWSDW